MAKLIRFQYYGKRFPTFARRRQCVRVDCVAYQIKAQDMPDKIMKRMYGNLRTFRIGKAQQWFSDDEPWYGFVRNTREARRLMRLAGVRWEAQ